MKAIRSVVLLVPASLVGSEPGPSQTPYNEVNDGIGTLQGWYNSSTGLYNSPAGWWNSANSITLLANYERAAGNSGYSSAFSSTFTNAQNTHANFKNNYYDDTAWWGLAWIDAYDLTGDSSYLSMAETMFSYETNGWTTTECQNISGHLQIWGIDTSNATVWTNWQSTDGGSWQNSWQGHGNVGGGGTIKPGFVCGQNANGNLRVFGVGSNGSLYFIWQAPGWTTTWANIGYPSGQPLPYLIVNTSSDGRVVVLGVSTISPYSVYGIWESGSNTYGTWVAWGNWSGGGYRSYAGQP